MAIIATPGPYVACNTMPDGYKTPVVTVGLGWFVAAPTGVPQGDLEATAKLLAAGPTMRNIIVEAERFIAGFEDDELQDGISGPEGLLARMRAVLAGTPAAADPAKHQMVQTLTKVAQFLTHHADAVSVDGILKDVETALAVGRGDASATTVADEILRDLLAIMPVPATEQLLLKWARGMRYISTYPAATPTVSAAPTASTADLPPSDETSKQTITVLCSWIDKLCDKFESTAAQTVDDVCDVSLAREAATLARQTHGVSPEVLGYSVTPSVWKGTGELHVTTTFIVYTPDGDRLKDDFGTETDAWAAARAHAESSSARNSEHV